MPRDTIEYSDDFWTLPWSAYREANTGFFVGSKPVHKDEWRGLVMLPGQPIRWQNRCP